MSLKALSPLDGRYYEQLTALRESFSEWALCALSSDTLAYAPNERSLSGVIGKSRMRIPVA
jgi:hypothetical protein